MTEVLQGPPLVAKVMSLLIDDIPSKVVIREPFTLRLTLVPAILRETPKPKKQGFTRILWIGEPILFRKMNGNTKSRQLLSSTKAALERI